MRFFHPALLLFLLISSLVLVQPSHTQSTNQTIPAQPTAPQPGNDWTFVVSGDSRNCGNVIMPAIAEGAIRNHAEFYLHLGDLRMIHDPDEDYLHEQEHRGGHLDKESYLKDAWDDFIKNQMEPFGTVPFFVGIGNHETIKPKSRSEFARKFAKWLDAPPLRKQRLADDPKDTDPKTYFHWIQNGVDFIYLDNASAEQFSDEQVSWVEGVIDRASANADVHSLVVGMHAALPDSLAAGHSMNDFQKGLESGRRVFNKLLDFRKKTKKNVYILASHSHFFMSGIFNSDYRQAHGGELPGWIVGTAGAVRYPLPEDAMQAKDARTKIYGYLLATVHADSSIDFQFQEIKAADIPSAITKRYTPELVDFCFNKNTSFH